jgi:hypothetical protein
MSESGYLIVYNGFSLEGNEAKNGSWFGFRRDS